MLLATTAAETVAQTPAKPAADSVAQLNRTGRWTDAAALASRSLSGRVLPLDEQCPLLFGLAYADARIARYDFGKEILDAFFEKCRTLPSAAQYLADAEKLRHDVDLPPLPRTGLDFSAVDEFWHVAGLLAADREPSEAEWRAMLSTIGYRLSLSVIQTTRADLEIALRPSQRATFDSLANVTGNSDLRERVQHLARAYANRDALKAYRDTVAKGLPIERAIAMTSRYLPPHATEGKVPPLVAFALFRGDGYSLGPERIIMDLDQARAADLTLFLAHEFHHSYLSGLNQLHFPTGPDASASLVRTLGFARNEGIADLIDKPYPLKTGQGYGEAYVNGYNAAYARTPAVIHSIDSALTVAADDSTKMQEVGMRVSQLLPSNGHYNGSYMAREIYETFGVDSLFPGVRNAFAFWRAYGEAEVKRGKPWPFSPKSTSLLDQLEKQYLARPAATAPFNF
jgi:hypothetical protein